MESFNEARNRKVAGFKKGLESMFAPLNNCKTIESTDSEVTYRLALIWDLLGEHTNLSNNSDITDVDELKSIDESYEKSVLDLVSEIMLVVGRTHDEVMAHRATYRELIGFFEHYTDFCRRAENLASKSANREDRHF
jgi:hypothetical protein